MDAITWVPHRPNSQHRYSYDSVYAPLRGANPLLCHEEVGPVTVVDLCGTGELGTGLLAGLPNPTL